LSLVTGRLATDDGRLVIDQHLLQTSNLTPPNHRQVTALCPMLLTTDYGQLTTDAPEAGGSLATAY